jgi:hypothetical protein
MPRGCGVQQIKYPNNNARPVDKRVGKIALFAVGSVIDGW